MITTSLYFIIPSTVLLIWFLIHDFKVQKRHLQMNLNSLKEEIDVENKMYQKLKSNNILLSDLKKRTNVKLRTIHLEIINLDFSLKEVIH